MSVKYVMFCSCCNSTSLLDIRAVRRKNISNRNKEIQAKVTKELP